MHAKAVSQRHALVVLWAQVPMGMANGCGSMLSGSVRLLRLSTFRCSVGWGEPSFSSATCGWSTRLLLSEVVWRHVVLAAIWAMEQGRKRLWS
jgi:hypothetical protein